MKRKGTTFVPLKGRGWVAIPSSDPEIVLNLDFNDLEPVLMSDYEQQINLDQESITENSYYEMDNISEYESEEDFKNMDLYSQSLSEIHSKENYYSQIKKGKYKLQIEEEEFFWNQYKETMQKKYLKFAYAGNRLSNCHNLESTFKCIDCDIYYCSNKCAKDDHSTFGRQFHLIKEWDLNTGWVDSISNSSIETCECNCSQQYDIVLCSVAGIQLWMIKGCVPHVLDALLCQGFFPGNPLISGKRIYCFQTRY
jgi:hypothetical protein